MVLEPEPVARAEMVPELDREKSQTWSVNGLFVCTKLNTFVAVSVTLKLPVGVVPDVVLTVKVAVAERALTAGITVGLLHEAPAGSPAEQVNCT